MAGFYNGSSSNTSHNNASKLLRLDPNAVRLRASSIPGCKPLPVGGPAVTAPAAAAAAGTIAGLLSSNAGGSTQQNQQQHHPYICSFLVDGNINNTAQQQQQQQRDVQKLARVVIFTDSGTVSIGRLLNGEYRQVFRRNVTSLDVVEDLLRHPPQLTVIDAETVLSSSTSAVSPRSALAQLELAEVGTAILHGEREKLSLHLDALEQQQIQQQQQQQQMLNQPITQLSPASSGHPASPSAAAAMPSITDRSVAAGGRNVTDHSAYTSADVTTSSAGGPGGGGATASASGMGAASVAGGGGGGNTVDGSITTAGLSGLEFQFSLPPESMKDVDQCLTDIHSMGKLVRKVSTNGKGSVFLYGNGGVAYTPHIPKALYHKLSQLRHSDYDHRPSYVSLGSRDRYFCSFNDGSHAFKGPKGMERELKKLKKAPLSVSFGSTYDTFCIVLHDGAWKSGGRAFPTDLYDKLGRGGDSQRRDVHTINLGPEGEWFLKLQNGNMWWGGIHSELDAAIQDLLDAGHYLHFLDFGDDGSYFVSYD